MCLRKILLSVVCLTFFAVPTKAQEAGVPVANMCETGKMQSPVNIEQYAPGGLPSLSIEYKDTALDVVNTGHTIQMYFEPGSVLRVGDDVFNLSQAEFYTPSEHYLSGAPYPMEVQFVHAAADGTIGILSVMVKLGKHNRYLQGLWDNIPMKGKRNTVKTVRLSAADFLPENKAYYAYDGSLTVAPCTEGVRWYIIQAPIEASSTQLMKFQKMFPRNARMIQPMNGRIARGSE